MEPEEPKPDEVTQPTEDSRQRSSPHELETRPATDGASTGQPPGRPPSYRLRPGQSFGPYEIMRILGHGGMGEVYEALEKESGHRVALKLLSTELSWSESQRMRFLREGTLAASINHPNSLYVYGTDEIDGIPIITMELAPGGTIKQRIDEGGELSPAEAVDAVLQIANGLQAAESAGILHRDIKPGNCFVDRDGSIKIGDFGLAISTSGPDTSNLTATGTFLGTPAFASPEQVRGSELDVRSDIYSVGATLYYLLTGRSPFEGAVGMGMMAAILENRPKSPASRKNQIPDGLTQVVQRCLDKDPAARPQTYQELKAILEPFGSKAPSPASPSTRFVGGLVDWVLLAILSAPFALLSEGEPQKSIPIAIAGIVLAWIYGGIFEGLWGATPGKRLVRLRVISSRGDIPGLARGSLRAILFWSIYAILNSGSLLLVRTVSDGGWSSFANAMLYLSGLGTVAIFLTARRENGWCGIHDRFSDTRVVQAPSGMSRAYAGVETTLPPVEAAGGRIGPYRVPNASQDLQPGEVVLGLDPTLQRKVWIRLSSPEVPSLSEERRNLSRPGRLRWLNGRRTSDESWDAFEAVAGQPFIEVIRDRQPWATVRYWLHDLAEEARHLSGIEVESNSLSLDRIWITSDGKALLLDFPVPSVSPEVTRDTTQALPGGGGRVGVFLSKVARAALSETSSNVHEAEGATLGPIPLHARQILQRLIDQPDRTPDVIAGELSRCLRSRTTISSRRRIGQLALAASPALVLTFFSLLGIAIGWFTIERNNPDINVFRESFKRLEEIESTDSPHDGKADIEREALQIYMAGPLRHVPVSDSISILGQEMPAIRWSGARKERLEKLLSEYADPSQEEIAEATETLSEFLAEKSGPRGLWNLVQKSGKATVVILAGLLTVMLPLYLLFGIVFRGGMSHRLLGLAVVGHGAGEASYFRCLYRAVVAWAPLLFCVFLFFISLNDPTCRPDGTTILDWFGFFVDSVTEGGLQVIAIAIFFIGVLWTIIRPTRGLHDRIARTFVVPR